MSSGRIKFDAIVIGSGIGGLTCAAILSKLGRKKVLVIEQHFTPGGLTHDFQRKGKFSWDVGLNYLGEMGEGDLGKAIFDYITNGKLKFNKISDPLETFVYPGLDFEVSSDRQKYQADLIHKFPHERKAIVRYFKDIQRASFWFIFHAIIECLPNFTQFVCRLIFKLFGSITRETTQHYLDRNFRDPRLKALLVAQLGTYNVPPSRSCFGINSVIATHYLNGAWYPIGGGQEIADNIIPTIERSGGKILLRRRAIEIIIESGVAVGVKVQCVGNPNAEPEIYHAPIIISNAGVINTYTKLLPPTYPLPELPEIEYFPKGSSIISLYLGLKENPQCLGFTGGNHWIYNTYDHEELANSIPIDSLHPPRFCFLTFPSLNNPLAKGHTAEIIVSGNYYYLFSQWQDKPWKKRGKDYMALKRQIIKSILKLIEYQYPGFIDIVEYAELATPITFEHFAGSHRGVVYGLPCVPQRFDQSWIGAKTPIKNLYLTGADTFSSGVMGAMMGGVKTAGLIDGNLGFIKIFTRLMLKQY